MNNPWPGLIGRMVGSMIAVGLVGAIFNQLFLFLFIFTLGCLIWQLLHLYYLERWLREGIPADPSCPRFLRSGAVWQWLYKRFMDLRSRSRKRKRKVSRILKQFQTAAAALPDAIVVLHEDDTVYWFNGAAQRLLGLRSVRDIGLTITTLLRAPSFVEFLSSHNYEDSLQLSSPINDSVMLSVRLRPYGKKRRLLLATDITRIHRLEQIRQDFVANVSHELRTPLTVISGYLETLRDSDHPCMEQWHLPLQRMHQQTHRMMYIIEGLLMIARLETHAEGLPQKPVAVPSMLAVLAEEASTLSGDREHCIQLEIDSQLWIYGCEQALRSAFSNLVFNAVRYTPAGGRIIIRWYADAQGAHLEVEDNGEGIAPQHLSRITERFYRVDRDRARERGGTGLGLAIAKHVMNHHNGKLVIVSRVGVGSLFACDFPLEYCLQASCWQSMKELTQELN